jgi:hypothetical protein
MESFSVQKLMLWVAITVFELVSNSYFSDLKPYDMLLIFYR